MRKSGIMKLRIKHKSGIFLPNFKEIKNLNSICLSDKLKDLIEVWSIIRVYRKKNNNKNLNLAYGCAMLLTELIIKRQIKDDIKK